MILFKTFDSDIPLVIEGVRLNPDGSYSLLIEGGHIRNLNSQEMRYYDDVMHAALAVSRRIALHPDRL